MREEKEVEKAAVKTKGVKEIDELTEKLALRFMPLDMKARVQRTRDIMCIAESLCKVKDLIDDVLVGLQNNKTYTAEEAQKLWGHSETHLKSATQHLTNISSEKEFERRFVDAFNNITEGAVKSEYASYPKCLKTSGPDIGALAWYKVFTESKFTKTSPLGLMQCTGVEANQKWYDAFAEFVDNAFEEQQQQQQQEHDGEET